MFRNYYALHTVPNLFIASVDTGREVSIVSEGN
jgi:hypothetical protein